MMFFIIFSLICSRHKELSFCRKIISYIVESNEIAYAGVFGTALLTDIRNHRSIASEDHIKDKQRASCFINKIVFIQYTSRLETQTTIFKKHLINFS